MESNFLDVAELIPTATLKNRGLLYNSITTDSTVSNDFNCDDIYTCNGGSNGLFIINVSANKTTPEQNGIVANLTRKGGANYTVFQFFISESKRIYRRIGKWGIGDLPQYDEWIIV